MTGYMMMEEICLLQCLLEKESFHAAPGVVADKWECYQLIGLADLGSERLPDCVNSLEFWVDILALVHLDDILNEKYLDW